MLKEPKAHFLKQREKQVRLLSAIPEPRRVEGFIGQYLTTADRNARQAAKLRTDERMAKVLKTASLRLDKLRAVLEDLHKTVGNDLSRSKCPLRRAGAAKRTLSEIG